MSSHSSSAVCLVLREIEHCPPSWVEAFHLAGFSGYWVGHSSERFAVELTSDREPGFGPAPGDTRTAREAKRFTGRGSRHGERRTGVRRPTPLIGRDVDVAPVGVAGRCIPDSFL